MADFTGVTLIANRIVRLDALATVNSVKFRKI